MVIVLLEYFRCSIEYRPASTLYIYMCNKIYTILECIMCCIQRYLILLLPLFCVPSTYPMCCLYMYTQGQRSSKLDARIIMILSVERLSVSTVGSYIATYLYNIVNNKSSVVQKFCGSVDFKIPHFLLLPLQPV